MKENSKKELANGIKSAGKLKKKATRREQDVRGEEDYRARSKSPVKKAQAAQGKRTRLQGRAKQLSASKDSFYSSQSAESSSSSSEENVRSRRATSKRRSLASVAQVKTEKPTYERQSSQEPETGGANAQDALTQR